MIDKFLKAKHWQLFLLTFGIPMILQFVIMGVMVSKITTGENHSPKIFFDFLMFMPIIMILFMGVFFGWFWSIAIGLDKKIPDQLKLNLNRFKIFFFIPLVYILCTTISISSMFYSIASTNEPPNMAFIGVLILLHLFSMFCIFYCLYFVAKTIKTAELQKEVHFGDFAGEFFLIWFFPIGIWFVQPKINKLIEDEKFQ